MASFSIFKIRNEVAVDILKRRGFEVIDVDYDSNKIILRSPGKWSNYKTKKIVNEAIKESTKARSLVGFEKAIRMRDKIVSSEVNSRREKVVLKI